LQFISKHHDHQSYFFRNTMDANAVSSLAKATLDGSMPFPQIVGKLIAEGVEYYHVDYATNSFTFYSASGAFVTAPLLFEGLPSVAAEFDATALKAAIRDSQQNGQAFRAFCERAILAVRAISMLNGFRGHGRVMLSSRKKWGGPN
jgi:uncharacterized protein YbcV (DUF1398 family)